METLTIKVKNRERLHFIYEMLQYFDFVELPEIDEVDENEPQKHDFFGSAGLWKNRDINQEILRKQAWKRD